MAQTRILERLILDAAKHRAVPLLASALMIAGIAIADWATKPYISLGFLYLFPIIILGVLLPRPGIVVVALLCALLQEAFSNLPDNEAIVRLLFSSAGFVGTGLLVFEMAANRRRAQRHVDELEAQIRLRHDLQEELRSLVESTPAAILTIDVTGRILLANDAAQQLLAPGGSPLAGASIREHLPALQLAVQSPQRRFRASMQCSSRRLDGELFLAGVWFSTYTSSSGPRLAAIVVDLSEELRSREDLSFTHLLKNNRILVGAVAHEIRNLSSAIVVVHKNLSRLPELAGNEDFQALGGLVNGLERIAALEAGATPAFEGETVELRPLLDELRILVEAGLHEAGIAVHWEFPDPLPLVRADHNELIQVFLNLVRNSQRALAVAPRRELHITVAADPRHVLIRFADSGSGVGAPETLFRPFASGSHSSGLGLYLSRAIVRSFGGELSYEPAAAGACFTIALARAEPLEAVGHA